MVLRIRFFLWLLPRGAHAPSDGSFLSHLTLSIRHEPAGAATRASWNRPSPEDQLRNERGYTPPDFALVKETPDVCSSPPTMSEPPACSAAIPSVRRKCNSRGRGGLHGMVWAGAPPDRVGRRSSRQSYRCSFDLRNPGRPEAPRVSGRLNSAPPHAPRYTLLAARSAPRPHGLTETWTWCPPFLGAS